MLRTLYKKNLHVFKSVLSSRLIALGFARHFPRPGITLLGMFREKDVSMNTVCA